MEQAQALRRMNAALGEEGREGVSQTAVAGTVCVRHSIPSTLQDRRWRACLAIVVRGRKDIVLGTTPHALGPGHFTLTPIPLAVTSRIVTAPFVCIIVGLDPMRLSQVVADMQPRRDEPNAALDRGLFQGELSAKMWGAAVRLVESFSSPEEAAVLGPGYVRELLFYLLRGPRGPAIRRFVRAGSEAHRISATVHRIESRLEQRLDIEALAAEARLSRTAFFEQFKRVTAHTPVQFQKRLRLLEAQRLIVEERTTAEDAAFRVGFASASQFSREYARMFGEPPVRHALRLREHA